MSFASWQRQMAIRAKELGKPLHHMPYRATKYLNRHHKATNRAANMAARSEINAERSGNVRTKPCWQGVIGPAAPFKPRDVSPERLR